MDVSIIIVNYNSIDVIIDCINSIICKTKDLSYEIIVVDNASPDKSADFIETQFGDKLKLIRSDINLGFGKANNLGADYAEGKYLFLLNPDTVLINNAIKVLYDFLEEHPEVGAVGGNLFGGDQISAAPSFCKFFDSVEYERKSSSWHKIISDKVKQKLKLTGRPFKNEFNYTNGYLEVAYIFGADIMMPRALFETVGGFDKDFFMYAEEAELQWRIQQRGYKIYNVPSAKIIHLEGMSSKQQNEFSERQFKWRMESTCKFFEKCYGRDAAEQFYHYRCRRYKRMSAIKRLHNRTEKEIASERMLKCLKDIYNPNKSLV